MSGVSYFFDFSNVPVTSSYNNPDFERMGSTTARILADGLRLDGDRTLRLRQDIPQDVIYVEATVNKSTSGLDHIGPAIVADDGSGICLISAGNGVTLRMSTMTLTSSPYRTGVIGSAFSSNPYEVGDTIGFRYTKATRQIEIFKNRVLIATRQDPVDRSGQTLKAGIRAVYENKQDKVVMTFNVLAYGSVSIGGDGLTPESSNVQVGELSPVIDTPTMSNMAMTTGVQNFGINAHGDFTVRYYTDGSYPWRDAGQLDTIRFSLNGNPYTPSDFKKFTKEMKFEQATAIAAINGGQT